MAPDTTSNGGMLAGAKFFAAGIIFHFSIPEIFFEWARAQSWDARENATVNAALAAFGIDTEEALQDFNELVISTGFKSWMSGKFGLHWSQPNYAPVSSRLTPATLVGLAVHYWRISIAN